MSPRNKRIRKVLNPPPIKGFKPYGPDIKKNEREIVTILFEEYEAIRLCDYDGYNHHNASEAMGVSRPTFTRIYASARRKIAKAFAEGSQISIEGGKVYFDSDWYNCSACNCYFNNPEKEKKMLLCPLCSSNKINPYAGEPHIGSSIHTEIEALCICQSCGFEQQHEHGKPCKDQICPACGRAMRRNLPADCKNQNQ
jgi:uncharacterized protein